MSAATMIGSTEACGCAAWPPTPLITMSQRLLDAIVGPARKPNWFTGMPGMLWMPNTASQGKRSNRPSCIMARAPALPPSSAGWKMNTTVPSKSRCVDRYCPRPAAWRCARHGRSRACGADGEPVREAVVLGHGQRVHVGAQAHGLLAAAGAQDADDAGFPQARVDFQAPAAQLSATSVDVRVSWKASSGWAWMSRRSAVSSGCARSISAMVFMAGSSGFRRKK